MAKRTKRSKAASTAAATRWAGLTPEERAEKMRTLAAGRVKVTAEDLELLQWVKANRETLAVIVDNFRAYQAEQAATLAELGELTPPAPPAPAAELVRDDAPATAGPGFRALDRGGFACITCGQTFPTLPERCATCARADELQAAQAAGLDVNAARCSVCMSVLTDLDAPCATCVAAGRFNASPESLHAAQAAHASPHAQAPTVYDTPRPSNAISTRAPIPPPEPPPRAYTASETCRSCGRLAELHLDKGGPIGHVYEPQQAG